MVFGSGGRWGRGDGNFFPVFFWGGWCVGSYVQMFPKQTNSTEISFGALLSIEASFSLPMPLLLLAMTVKQPGGGGVARG